MDLHRVLLPLLAALLLAPVAMAEDGTDDASGWKQIYSRGGVTAYRNFTGDSKLAEFKGVGVIDEPFHKVVAVYEDVARAKEWVSDATASRLVEQMGPDKRVCYNYTDLPWPVADRDFVYEEVWKFYPEQGRVNVVIRSVEHSKEPPAADSGKTIRGTLLYSEFDFTRVDADSTRVIARIHTNPNGSVPASVVNMVTRKWPFDTVTNLRKQCGAATGYEAKIKEMEARYPLP